MQPIIQTDITKPRKNQIFKWSINKNENAQITANLSRFLELLGFTPTDTLAYQLRHETLGYFLEGTMEVNQLEQGFSSLAIDCETQSLGRVKKYLRTENENGFGIFYAVLGSRKEDASHPQQVRFHVVDYDTGKQSVKVDTEEQALEMLMSWEADKQYDSVELQSPNRLQKQYKVIGYYSEERIQQLKADFLKRHSNDLATAIIVDTANGFHIYYRVTEASIHRFSEVQYALAKKFGGDASIVDHARIIRLPYFFHVKNPEKPYYVSVIQWGLQHVDNTQVVHTQEGLIRALALETSAYHSEKITVKSKVDGVTKTKNRITTLTPHKSVKATFYDANGEATNELSFLEFLEQVKKLPLDTFFSNYEFTLHKGQSFQCLFHEDSQPSATTYRSASGIEQYKCFSPSCAATSWTVIDLVMNMIGVGIIDTVQYLSNLAGVKITQTEFQQQTLNMLHHNFNWIRSNLECKNVLLAEKPLLYKFFTQSMKRLAKELMVQLLSYPIQDSWSYEGKPIFFASADYLAQECQMSRKTVQQNLDLLVLLGFFSKMPHHLVPKSMFRRNSSLNVVNYYTVNAFDEVAMVAENLVDDLNKRKFKKKEISFDYLVATFGEEEAQRVYPNQYQQTIKQPRKAKPKVVKEYTQVAFETALEYVKTAVRKKGYVKEAFLHKHLLKTFNEQNTAMPTRKWQATMERASMYLQTNGYVRRSLTKAVAKELGLKQAQKKNERIYVWTKKE